MDLKDYQTQIRKFAIYPEANSSSFIEMNYLVLGLVSEAGEVAGKLKKLIRDNSFNEEAYLQELGDVLWYLTRIADTCGISVEELAEMNYLKLSERAMKGKLKGNGDHRERDSSTTTAQQTTTSSIIIPNDQGCSYSSSGGDCSSSSTSCGDAGCS